MSINHKVMFMPLVFGDAMMLEKAPLVIVLSCLSPFVNVQGPPQKLQPVAYVLVLYFR